jgi:hypothetical protein
LTYQSFPECLSEYKDKAFIDVYNTKQAEREIIQKEYEEYLTLKSKFEPYTHSGIVFTKM